MLLQNNMDGDGRGGKDDVYEGSEWNEESYQLNEDTFTFFLVSPISSWNWVYASLFYAIQLNILIIALVGLLGEGIPGNQLNIPLYTRPEVKLAQALALLTSVITARDVIQVLDILEVKYIQDEISIFPHATQIK